MFNKGLFPRIPSFFCISLTNIQKVFNFSLRDSFERLCQEGQALNEGGRGDGSETRVSAQLQSQHQALLRRVRERLHSCQLTLQEQQAFEDTLQTTWTWLNGVQERLASLNSTLGNKETLEKRLGLVQVSSTKTFGIWTLLNYLTVFKCSNV